MTRNRVTGNLTTWLFDPTLDGEGPAAIWKWWETRRLAYNIFTAAVSVLGFVLFAWIYLSPGMLNPGEDLIEPIAYPVILFGLPIGWNLAYTLGPIVHCYSERLGSKQPRLGPYLLKMGMLFSAFLLSIPSLGGLINWTSHVVSTGRFK